MPTLRPKTFSMKIRPLRRSLAAILAVASIPVTALAQDGRPHAGMLQFPDISASHITFVYANDLWVVPRDGGQARLVANPAGSEQMPRFSADGQTIAFVGNYEGDRDLYTIGLDDETPFRVTHHPANEMFSDWTADGGLVFSTWLYPGSHAQAPGMYHVDAEGGMPEAMPVPYGGNGAVSADGEWLAYTPSTREFRTWKRYQGGLAQDIWLFNLETNESVRVTDYAGTDTQPMWHGEKLYYLSDDTASGRLNLFVYDTGSRETERVTDYTDNDVKFPAIGPGTDGGGEIIFQLGSELVVLDLATAETRNVEVTVPGVRSALRERNEDASQLIMDGTVSATGVRAAVEARGDIWTLAAESGPPRNLTDTDGFAERTPAWSPSGKWISYFSDESGEYNLYITQSDGKGETIQLTDIDGGYFFSPQWSPDSKKIMFQDQRGHIYITTLADGDNEASTQLIDTMPDANQGTPANWSHDSNWVTYARPDDRAQVSAIWVCNLETGEKTQITETFFHADSPAFDTKGEFLYYVSYMDFTDPQYDDWGRTFAYSGTGQLVAVPLRGDVASPFLVESDEETWEDEVAEDEDAAEGEDAEGGDEDADDVERHPLHGTWSGVMKGFEVLGLPEDEIAFTLTVFVDEDGNITGTAEMMGESDDAGTMTFDEETNTLTVTDEEDGIKSVMTATLDGDTLTGTWSLPDQGFNGSWEATKTGDDAGDEPAEDDASDEPLVIDFDGIRSRGMMLPVASGQILQLSVNSSNQLIYLRVENGMPSIKLFDMHADDPSEGNVVSGVGGYAMSGDGKKLGVMGPAGLAIINAAKGQSLANAVPTDNMMVRINPRDEWRMVVRDVWRRYRDFFYVENMHGVDWDKVHAHYDAMIDDAVSRQDIDYIIGEMIGEINVGHAYNMGGQSEMEPSIDVGMLGADLELATTDEGTAYRVADILEGAAWDIDARGPLSEPGIDIHEGDFILAVNGRPIDTDKDPWASFLGLAGDVVTLTVSAKPVMDDEAREVTLTLTDAMSEMNLRFRQWVESNRQYIFEKSGGRIAYIYVPDTGVNGQNELFRQFYGQMHMDAMVVDDRFNGGGQIPDRFIELLNRPVTNQWAVRNGRDWQWPPDSAPGPKAMLINGWAGSGGDMFPWLFKEAGLGPLIGTRTWGGLVGIGGMPPLTDGGYVTVPNFGFYELDGTWGIEGYGVAPDIEVVDDPALMLEGDPQMDKAVEVLLEALENGGQFTPADRPADPDRSGIGIPDTDR
ncbi:PDZ domain-containing protein [Phycisphaeraceae bacterium D3-23]